MEPSQTPSQANPSLWQQIQPKHVFTIFVLSMLALVAYAARDRLGPYIVGIVIAYLILPVAQRIAKAISSTGHLQKQVTTISVIAAVLLVLVSVVLLGYALVNQTVDDFQELADSLPAYWQDITEDGDFGDYYQENVPADTQQWITEHMDDISETLTNALKAVLDWLFGITGGIVQALTAFVIIPVFATYFLLSREGAERWLRRTLPQAWTDDAISALKIADRSMADYTRGVIVSSLVVGAITTFAYWVIGVDLWLPLGMIAFFGEIVPIIGPWIAFFISFPVILATQPEKALLAVAAFAIIQALEGWFISPKIQGDSIDFSPAAILVLLAIGGAIGGPIGIVVALPFATILRGLIVYTMRRLEGAAPAIASIGLTRSPAEVDTIEESIDATAAS